MLGLNQRAVIEAELGDLNDKRTDIDFDPGDYARQAWGALFGKDYSKGTLLKKAAEMQAEKINNNNEILGKTAAIEETLGGTGVDTSDLGIRQGETSAQYRKRLAKLQALGTATSNYGLIENADLSKIQGGTTVQQINKLARDLRTSNKDADKAELEVERLKLRGEAETDLQAVYARQDELTRRQNARTDLLNAQTRQDALELRRDNMNLEYARLDRQDRQDAQNRKDQQIMLLVQGLSNLGMGFTV